jgi:large subunit ribosomal protein L19e
MSIKLSKRIAARLLRRGVSSIRVQPGATADAAKAITSDDVRDMIKKGSIYALKEKENLSLHAKNLKKKRQKGRRRGPGKRHGTRKARGSVEYKRKIRGQRRVLDRLKQDKTLTNDMFKEFYRLVKGGTFPNKASLLGHIKGRGITLSEERVSELKHI